MKITFEEVALEMFKDLASEKINITVRMQTALKRAEMFLTAVGAMSSNNWKVISPKLATDIFRNG